MSLKSARHFDGQNDKSIIDYSWFDLIEVIQQHLYASVGNTSIATHHLNYYMATHRFIEGQLMTQSIIVDGW